MANPTLALIRETTQSWEAQTVQNSSPATAPALALALSCLLFLLSLHLRKERRTLLSSLSVRPSPGTSDLLHAPLSVSTAAGIGARGKLVAVDSHDLVRLAPMHLLGGEIDWKGGKRG